MKLTDLTPRELAGITHQAAQDGPPGVDPVEWFTGRAAYDAEQMAKNADLAEPTSLAKDIAALPEESRAKVVAVLDAEKVKTKDAGVVVDAVVNS